MGAFARRLAANLAAGLRLALFLPVRRLAFRADVAQLIALFVVSALVDIGADALRYGDEGVFSWFGLGNEVLAGGLLLLTAAVLALAYRDRTLTLAVPVIALAAFPVLQFANALPWQRLGVPAWLADILDRVVLAWIVVVLVRCVYAALEYRGVHRPWRALAGGLLLAAPIFYSSSIAPVDPWFAPVARDAPDPRYPSPASEPVLAMQKELLDDALASLEDGRPGIVDLYFVGFAADASEDVFRKDVEAARRVMDEKWGTADRSLLLVNNPRTLLTTPIATLSNLRDALEEIGAAMDVDEDIAMVYLAAHADRSATLDLRLPPLELVPITPALLRSAFDDANIRYRIVVVSACYSGAFVDALADEDTAVIVAAQADRTSFGCGVGSDATFFGEAFFQDGMAKAAGLAEAFELARAGVGHREREQGLAPPSNPQMRIGAGMQAKLAELRRRGGAAQQHAARRAPPRV
ncbi:MAG TPA: C13 family peptidase [Casimicrobiaceae bacterium]|nr:C13 family peptidase [Casimicrobiaceae bacterium]